MPKIWTTFRKLPRNFLEEAKSEIPKKFFQEVYMCEEESLYVDGGINYQGVLTTQGRGVSDLFALWNQVKDL
jgi:hypothetical protein